MFLLNFKLILIKRNDHFKLKVKKNHYLKINFPFGLDRTKNFRFKINSRYSLFDRRVRSEPHTNVVMDQSFKILFDQEFEKYWSLICVEIFADPLEFYRNNHKAFPIIATMV